MVSMGADVDLKDMEGGTALRLADSFGQREVADFLRPLRDSGSGRWTPQVGDYKHFTVQICVRKWTIWRRFNL